jgi:DNA-binding response OmpR family regulator
LLVAEDDVSLGHAVTRMLMRLGHTADWVTSGERVIGAVREFRYDCVLLDLRLPDIQGDTCLRAIRREANDTPIVIVTANVETLTKIEMLDSGADDYIAKPFDFDELIARIRAVVRRNGQREASEERIEIPGGVLTIHRSSQAILLNGQPKMLTRKEFWLLEALVRQRDRILTRQALEEALYGVDDDLSSNTVEVYVHQLRRKLGSDLIRTVRGVGYRLAQRGE